MRSSCLFVHTAKRLARHDRHYFGSYSDLDNMPAVEAARENNMGVFIISPTDKGGRLFDPTPKVAAACAPLHPMLWHDLYLLTRIPGVNVLSLGAAEPGNFEEHLKALSYVGTEEGERLVDEITAKLDSCKLEAMGKEYLERWSDGLPHWDVCTEAQINVKIILWLRYSPAQTCSREAQLSHAQQNAAGVAVSPPAFMNRCFARTTRILVKSFGMVAYAKERYRWVSHFERAVIEMDPSFLVIVLQLLIK